MRINETFSYEGKSVEQAYASIVDQGFRSESCARQGSTDYSVEVVEKADGGHLVTIVRTMPTAMSRTVPDFIKKFAGDTVKVQQTEDWGGPGADGGRTAIIRVNVIGQPAEMNGTTTLIGSEVGAAFTIDGEVKVSMPFIGKKVEPEIAKAIIASVRQEVAFAQRD